jgi:hypothetical protein
MKKATTLLFAMLLASTTLFSQESTFNVGDKVLNASIGFGSTLYSGSFYSTAVPPVSASLEFGIKDGILDKGVIGVGGYVGYSSYKWEYSGWGYKYNDIMIAARGAFHYPFVDKLDTYFGILLGAEIVTYKETGDAIPGYDDYSTSGSGMLFSTFIGGRYYFTENFAGLLELGWGVAYLNLGIALKF